MAHRQEGGKEKLRLSYDRQNAGREIKLGIRREFAGQEKDLYSPFTPRSLEPPSLKTEKAGSCLHGHLKSFLDKRSDPTWEISGAKGQERVRSGDNQKNITEQTGAKNPTRVSTGKKRDVYPSDDAPKGNLVKETISAPTRKGWPSSRGW